MTMGIREDRLVQELAHMEELRRQSSFIDFVAKNDPPDEYVVTFTCRGLVERDKMGDEHVAQIYLPAKFPRQPPKVSFLTPSFHPNIAALIQMSPVQARIQDMLNRAPDEETRQKLQQEILSNQDLFTARVCLDTLDHNWSPAITLDLICLELAEMIQYKRYNPADPLNQEAAIWAVLNQRRLPVDTRSILDLKALAGIRILSETTTDPDIPIILHGADPNA
jgi:ubiquitin-protein ligase